jgi:K+-transporting ATPase A subunit
VRLAGWFEISLTLALVLAAAYPIGAFMADVFDNRTTFLMVGDAKQGRALLIAMAILFAVALVVFYWSEARGNPILTALGVDPSQGNMEGKDLRFGQAGLALFAQATTGTGAGASNGISNR